jgi:hypothetical protein
MMYATIGRVLASARRLVGPVMLLAALLQGCSSDGEIMQEPQGLRGELMIRIADYEDQNPSLHYFLITEGGQEYELVFEQAPELEPGSLLEVHGPIEEGETPRIVVDSFSLIDDGVETSEQPLLNSTPRSDYSVAVLLVHWGSPDTMTTATMKGKLFTNADSTSNFFRESSHGIQGISGEAFGWYQIGNPGGCNASTIATSAKAAAAAAGVDLSKYKQIMYYFPRYSSCSWAGLGQIGSPSSPATDSWYNGYSDCVVLSHELGHNWGLMHAHSCTSSLPSGSGTCSSFSEYGDPFCPMGGGCYQMNAVEKGEMGWYGKCNIVTANTGGTFDLVPIETSSDGIQALRVPRGNGRYLYIESRGALGLFDTIRNDSRDAIYNGVLIHEGPEVQPIHSNLDSRAPYLIDANSATSTMNDAALGVGQTYTNGNISITLSSKSSASAKVQVSVSGGTGNALCMDGTVYGGTTPTPTSAATLFQHCNYTGWQAGVGVGDYTTAQLQALGVLDNDASSLQLASGYQAMVYDSDNFTGTSVTYTASNTCFVANSFNDKLSSMRVRSTTPVKLYQHCSYTGWQASLPFGDYTTAQLQALGVLNNDASSLQIPAGYTVTLYDSDNFTGTSVTLTADTSCLVANSFNDKVSSIRVR